MTEVKRYTATELRFSTTASGDYVAGAVFDELRQQLADVTNELDVLRAGFSHQAKLLEEDAETIESLEGRLEVSEAELTESRNREAALQSEIASLRN